MCACGVCVGGGICIFETHFMVLLTMQLEICLYDMIPMSVQMHVLLQLHYADPVQVYQHHINIGSTSHVQSTTYNIMLIWHSRLYAEISVFILGGVRALRGTIYDCLAVHLKICENPKF